MSYAASHNLLSMTLQLIDGSQEIVFAISQESHTRNTGIALIFDKVPKISVEFGPELGKGGSNPNAVGNGLKINEFDEETMSIIYSIRSLPSLTLSQKNKARQLFSDLLDIQMGMYDLLRNNCHDYVMKAYDVIAAFEKGCLSAEDEEVKQALMAAIKPSSYSNSSAIDARGFQQSDEMQPMQPTNPPASQKPSILSATGKVVAAPIMVTGEVAKVAGNVAKTGVKATGSLATGTVHLAAGTVGAAAQGTAQLATGAVGLAANTVGTVADIGVGLVSGTANLIGNVFKNL